MGFFKHLARLFSFTEAEKRVLLVLSAGLIAGVAISAYKGYKAELPDVKDFSEVYALGDSIFVERSDRIPDLEDSEDTAPPLVLLAPHSINVNTASIEELTLLPGIGKVYAERIILYREDYGLFRSADDLLNIRGIGPRRLEQITPYITF